MNRIETQLKKISDEKRIGVMTHVIVGYPSLEKTEELVIAMAKNGADFVELQIPFSDPVADGPVILKASQEALDNGVRTEDVFTLAKNLRKKGINIPLIIMTYANIVMAQGIENFIEKSAKADIDAFILPDLLFDTPEGQKIYDESKEKKIEMIPLYAPTMQAKRYNFLKKYSQNLIYAVSRTGVTGTKGFSNDIDEYLEKIKKSTNAHIALGFGIQSEKQIQDLYGIVDIAVIGSHLVQVFDEKGVEGVSKFLQKI